MVHHVQLVMQLAPHTSTRPFRHHATAACWSNIAVQRLVPACLRMTEPPSTLAVYYVTRLHMSCTRMVALDACDCGQAARTDHCGCS
jgi:hypothetical protein